MYKRLVWLVPCLALFLAGFEIMSPYLWTQFFEDDLDPYTSDLTVQVDSTDSLWQIGPPQKTLFSSAASPPNAILTDTLLPYPPSDTASFIIGSDLEFFYDGIIAYQWMQKLDMDSLGDWGKIEYSFDSGAVWYDAFQSPYTYSLYGFNAENVGILPDSSQGFTGVDTAWRNIWLCFDSDVLNFSDSLLLRFTFISDSVDEFRDGWMMDNFMLSNTIFHTINQGPLNERLNVYPNPTQGPIRLDIAPGESEIEIQSVALYDLAGTLIRRLPFHGDQASWDFSDLPPSTYLLNVKTHHASKLFRIQVQQP
ncbi:T9SS type A sorting domain-containing protein [Pontibacter sp. G13]|uniref:T9SS type A sorting domain-containing protein n=1 Tax=Pontibacter sp. G13 TaxID=3074898 RepID=UPI00288A3D1F|nr:T9SS type A sorting domain-containing protein [Pontibacter sp. G13]WNJ17411.1 T9SS type A sorting domain-containing protein [Pontibacter sp. G13]